MQPRLTQGSNDHVPTTPPQKSSASLEPRRRRPGRTGKKLAKVTPVSKNHAVGLAFQRSKTFGLGKVQCWVDDREEEAVVLDGYWEEPIRNSVV